MGTIADKLNNILECKADIKSAIEEQGVTVGDAPLSEYAGKIEQISGGGAEEAPENDVNFYDYDGFRVASYTIEEAKALTELPTPPSHEGLTFQEWNWSLEDIKTYDRQYADIGANYITTDGKTHLHITVAQDDLSITLKSTGLVSIGTIDWGDGTLETVTSINPTHSYIGQGVYVIKVTCPNPYCCSMFATQEYHLNEINLGENYNIGYGYIFQYHNCKISFSKDCVVDMPTGIFYLANVPVITLPKTTNNLTGTTMFYNFRGRIVFPRVVSSYNKTLTFSGLSTDRLILPHFTTAESIQYSNIISSQLQTRELSIPLSFNFGVAGVYFSGWNTLRYIDIAQGWTPTQSLGLSGSAQWTTLTMVKFFNKLGTTSTAITLTFGATNLNKLTEEEKAIATNKGYTLA